MKNRRLKDRRIISTGAFFNEEPRKLDSSHPLDLDGGKLYAAFNREKRCWEDIVADICNDWLWMTAAVIVIVLVVLWVW